MSSITDQISSLMGKFDDMTNPYLSHLKNNQYVSAILYLLLILYAGLAAPRLPYSVAKWFDNTFVKLVLFFLIVYIAKSNASVALIVALAVWISMLTANKYLMMEHFASASEDKSMCQHNDINCKCSVNGCKCGTQCDCGEYLNTQYPVIDNSEIMYKSCGTDYRNNDASKGKTMKLKGKMNVEKMTNINGNPKGVPSCFSDLNGNKYFEEGKGEKPASLLESGMSLVDMDIDDARRIETAGCIKENYRKTAHHQYKDEKIDAGVRNHLEF